MGINVESILKRIEKKNVYSVKEMNELTGIPIGTIRHWIYVGKLKKKKIGGKVYIYGQDMWDLLNN